jgi:phage shock protein C
MAWNNHQSGSGPFRLYRDPEHGVIAGVCAGIADFVGVERVLVRVGFVVGLLFFTPVTAITYVVLALALKPRPPALYTNPEEEAFWRGVSSAPVDTLTALKRRFRDLEDRLSHMESQVTSGDFDLHRKFRDLGR